jgi:5-dehydro-2-deoxygluconokinase
MYRTNCADLQITCSQLDESYIAEHKMLLISGTSLSHSPAREAVFASMELAKRNNTRICLDLDYRDGTWDNLDEASLYFSLAANKADFVIGTREEFDVLEYTLHPGNTSNDRSAQWLLDMGVKLIAIKIGKRGSFVYDGKNRFNGGIYPTTVLKSFGAGDSFSGAFNTCLIRGKSIPEALQFAAAASSITITGHSCSDAMPTLTQVQDYMVTHEYLIQ